VWPRVWSDDSPLFPHTHAIQDARRASHLGKPSQRAGAKPEKKTYLRIMVNCPTANKLVYTGMATDEVSFRSEATSYASSFICSECSESHLWEKQDAFLLP